MARLARFSVSLEAALLKQFDRLVAAEGYPTRSEAVKTLMRRALIDREWTSGEEVAGAVTMVYDHHRRGLVSSLMDAQHEFAGVIISTQHIHLDHHNCLEMVVVKGRVERIRELMAALKAVKGLKHCELVMTTTGRGLG